MTSSLTDGVSLASILGHQSVDVLNNIVTDWGGEDSWKADSGDNTVGVLRVEDRDNWATHYSYCEPSTLQKNIAIQLHTSSLLAEQHARHSFFRGAFFRTFVNSK